MKGSKVRVLIEPNLGPFEWKYDDTWYNVR